MSLKKLLQILKYANLDSIEISQMQDVSLSKSSIYRDILKCYFKYDLRSIQYKKEKFWQLSSEQRDEIGKKYQLKNKRMEEWANEFYENNRFLIKWSAYKYEGSLKLQRKRIDAYCNRYNLGDHCYIGHSVLITRHHYSDETINTGARCHISEDVNIDYTGGLTLGCGVVISEGVKIFTHNHVVDFSGKDESKGCEKTPLIIQDRVWIGARAIIMPGVNEIGRGALISSCSYVRSKVPPYAVVMGNPAKIVAFRLLPKEIIEFEKKYYPESEQIPLEILEQNYNKYFIGRIKDIKEFVKQ